MVSICLNNKSTMKTIIIYIAILLIPFSIWAQDKEAVLAPAIVQEEFYQAYPDVSDVHWKQMDDSYQASFIWEARRYHARYSIDGTWVETATPVVINETPMRAQEDFLVKGFDQWELLDVSMVDNPGNERLYRFKLRDGDKIFTLIYDSNGNLVR